MKLLPAANKLIAQRLETGEQLAWLRMEGNKIHLPAPLQNYAFKQTR